MKKINIPIIVTGFIYVGGDNKNWHNHQGKVLGRAKMTGNKWQK
jgi:hypothetical protein